MNETLPRYQESTEHPAPTQKKGFGCLLNALIGLFVFVVAIVIAAWLLLLHSSLPLRGVAAMIEGLGSQSHLKVTGISGSLSSGLQFKTMNWDNGEITDVRVRYSGIMDIIRRKQLILREVHVGSALIETTFKNEKPQDANSPKNSRPAGKPADWPLRLLQIDRVSLNNIVIKDRTSGVTLNIPKIEWTGFKAEKDGKIEFGTLDAESNYLTLKTIEPTASIYQKRLEIEIMPKMHPSILKPIRMAGEFGVTNEKLICDIQAFDDKVRLNVGADGIGHLRAEGVNLADFIDGPLPQNLKVDAEVGNPDATEQKIKVHSGSFQLGMRFFEIQPTSAIGPKDHTKASLLLAESRDGQKQLRYEIAVTETESESLKPVITSMPPMSPEDILATLFHQSEFSSLSPADQDGVKRRVPWFSFSAPR
ncbi:MAG: hypothetical protein K8R87_03240 [Verrucomicrobia bacterium]|nr:hypothetical protein [Verrucomicrobiota bacterium]